jgi:hypothetical protein
MIHDEVLYPSRYPFISKLVLARERCLSGEGIEEFLDLSGEQQLLEY